MTKHQFKIAFSAHRARALAERSIDISSTHTPAGAVSMFSSKMSDGSTFVSVKWLRNHIRYAHDAVAASRVWLAFICGDVTPSTSPAEFKRMITKSMRRAYLPSLRACPPIPLPDPRSRVATEKSRSSVRPSSRRAIG